MPITGFYAGLLVPLYIVLAARVIGVRRGAKISVGDGGDASLLRRIRVHANFAEYVPFALLLMALAESTNASRLVLHGLGIALVVARLSHAVGMTPAKDILPLRVLGVVLTFTVLIVAAVACISAAVQRGILS